MKYIFQPPSTPDVEQFPIQFNYHDGHIDTQLCTDSADSQASLNIKRAAVSMFQSAVMQDNGVTTRHEVRETWNNIIQRDS